MKNDSISASSKIKELFDLHKSGILGDEDYHSQLKSWIIGHLNERPLKELIGEKEAMKISKKGFRSSFRKFKEDEYDSLKADMINIDNDQPIKEKVEKILWILLN